MKLCPTCHKSYDDDTMVFCLDDGARLVDQRARDENATLNLPPDPTIAAPAARPGTPPTTPNPIPTITAKPEHFQMSPAYPAAPQTGARHSGRSPLPWIFAIVLVLGLSGVVIAWLVTRGGDDLAQDRGPKPTPLVSPDESPLATPESTVEPTPDDKRKRDDSSPPPRPTAMPTPPRPKQTFAVLNNISFNGSRITYYPRPSFGQCQADCAGNANCRGFTWIRPGAYNPGDSAMCYLMSAVTARVPHACCISGVRN